MRVRLSSPVFPYLSRLADGLTIMLSAWIAALLWQWSEGEGSIPFFTEPYLLITAAGAFLHIFFVGNLNRSWRGETFLNILIGAIEHWISVSVLLLIWLFVFKSSSDYSRLWFGLWVVIGIIMISVQRIMVYSVLRGLRKQGRNTKAIAIIGDIAIATQLKYQIQSAGWSGYRVFVTIDELQEHELTQLAGLDEIWIAIPMNQPERIKSVLYRIRHLAVVKRIVPDEFTLSLMGCGISNVVGVAMLDLATTPFSGEQKFIKLIEDQILALGILILISPLMLIIALGIKLTSQGPVIFSQQRLGMNNQPFRLYKFRTMKQHIESAGKVSQATQNDKRITAFGRFLRRTSLDELPQFINVLKGDMSIVGPRPHAIEHNEEYKDLVQEYMHRHLVKPGITGWAQINGYRGETDQIYKMQKRVECDMYYIQNWSLMLDLKIIFVTIFKGFISKNAY